MSGWNFPGGPVVENLPCMQGTQIQFLVGKLGSHLLQGSQACVLQLRPDAVKLKKKGKCQEGH